MNSTSIQQLLDKYFEGATSLAEEQQLRTYFNSSEVAETLRSYQPLFQYFEQKKTASLPKSFDANLEQQLERPAKRRFLRRRILQMASVAASVLLVTVSYFGYYATGEYTQASEEINWAKYEITDPDRAMQETKIALKLLSKKMNKGAKKAAKSVDKMQLKKSIRKERKKKRK